MAFKLQDFECDTCGHIEEHILAGGEEALCSKCSGGMSVIFLKAPYTDVHGCEQWDSVNEISFTSESERRKKMKNYAPGLSFEPSPSADKHHGARNESHLNLGKTYSYKGARCS
jgi:hypothetical protein